MNDENDVDLDFFVTSPLQTAVRYPFHPLPSLTRVVLNLDTLTSLCIFCILRFKHLLQC